MCSVIVAAVVLHSKMMIFVVVKFDGGWKAHDVAGSDDSLYLVGDWTLFSYLCLYLTVPMFMYLMWLCLLCISRYC